MQLVQANAQHLLRETWKGVKEELFIYIYDTWDRVTIVNSTWYNCYRNKLFSGISPHKHMKKNGVLAWHLWSVGCWCCRRWGEGRGKVSIDKNWMIGYDTILFMNNKVYICVCVCVIHNSNTCLYQFRGIAWGFPGGTSGKELPC